MLGDTDSTNIESNIKVNINIRKGDVKEKKSREGRRKEYSSLRIRKCEKKERNGGRGIDER